MQQTTKDIFEKLYRPAKDSHKGKNGKLTIIGGSRLFHGASLWSLKIASRIVDMVFYSTVKENVELTKQLKSSVYDFINVPRAKIEDYIEQSDAVLIGPGLVRGSAQDSGTGETGEQTKELTKKLLDKFPSKKWIIDAGSLQVMVPEWLKKLNQVVITPHKAEFENLFGIKIKQLENEKIEAIVSQKAKEYGCVIVLKGPIDIICSCKKCVCDTHGNPGMTKGGTGDVLAGLVAALACKNDLFLAAQAGAFAQGLAGDRLFARVAPYFNASDLCDEIPTVLKELMGY